MIDLDLLTVRGTDLVDEAGRPVRLAGVGLGGWMNMENFITGYPGNEEAHPPAAAGPHGRGGVRARSSTRFLPSFFDEADAALPRLARHQLGPHPVQLPPLRGRRAPFELKEEGFARLDRVDRPARPPRALLDPRPACAARTAEPALAQRQPDARRRVLEAPALPGPGGAPVGGARRPLQGPARGRRLQPDQRAARPDRRGARPRSTSGWSRRSAPSTPRHVLFLDGNRYSTDFSVFDAAEPLANTVYTAHDYALPGIADARRLPGRHAAGEYFDRAVVEQTFLRRTEFMRRTGTPIWIGEFGPVYSGDPEQDAWRYQLLRDQLEIYREHGASWALWTYKDIGLQGLVHAAPGSAYLDHVGASSRRRRRLGVDSWGGSDDGIRDVSTRSRRSSTGSSPTTSRTRGAASRTSRCWCATSCSPSRWRSSSRSGSAASTPSSARELAASFRFDESIERAGLSAVLRDAPRQLTVRRAAG